ncbi:HNH endonuclease [Lentibacillus cibarius]|uniref:HNH endonuclease n=1 Tax=Lentibacillus cibarius TaxID=2583219 RepID=UPI00163DA8AC|nr:HNH endonuclease signature motif containing protein [Lentibacillus cibarius]
MGVSIGDACRLYKKCKICGEIKYVKKFPTIGGKQSNPTKRKSYCWKCKDRKHERKLGSSQEYSFDTSVLDTSKEITIRGRDSSNYKFENTVSYDKAKRLVEEGAVGIFHSTLIHHFFNRKSLKKFVLERDGFICYYCGFYGDTIDHKISKSKGGLSTPRNCVCSCGECNSEKADMRYKEYLEIINVRFQQPS